MCNINTPSGNKIVRDKAGFFLKIKNGKIDKKNMTEKTRLLKNIFFVINFENLLKIKYKLSFFTKISSKK